MQSLLIFTVSFLGVMAVGYFLFPARASTGTSRWRRSMRNVFFLAIAACVLWGLTRPIWPPTVESGRPFPPPPETDRPFLSGSGQVFVWIPPGSFTLGSPDGEAGRSRDEGPQRRIVFDHGFWMAVSETTLGQFQSVSGQAPREGSKQEEPVSALSWFDALDFCMRLSLKDRKAERIPTDWVYCLPTEAQWEYACRAGSTGPFAFGEGLDASEGIFRKPSAPRKLRPATVARRRSNDWGLFDMHGNVAEWCLDAKHDYSTRRQDASGESIHGEGPLKVVRGGHWRSRERSCRSAARAFQGAALSDRRTGFRCVLGPRLPHGFPRLGLLETFDLRWTLLFLLPLIWGIRWSFRGRAAHLNRTFARFAHLYKGQWEAAEATTYPKASFPYRGLVLELDYFATAAEEGKLYTVLTVDLRDAFTRVPPRLEVAPRFVTRVRPIRFRGLDPWQGAEADSPLRTLNVLSDGQSETTELFRSGLEAIIVDLSRVVTLDPTYVSLHPGRLEIKKLHTLTTLGQLRAFTALTLRLLDLLIARYGQALAADEFQICEGGESQTRIPVCGICGEDVSGTRFVCSSCESPHHPECWEYNGLCSTFACGCESYREELRTGEAPRPDERQ